MNRTGGGKTSHMISSADESAAQDADAVARAAAVASEVEIRGLAGVAEVGRLCALFEGVWGSGPGQPVGAELLRIFGHPGNYVSGAFDGDGLVGGCVAFRAAPVGAGLHSHVAGVSARAAGRHVGFALKV